LELSVYRDESAFGRLQAEWNDLLAHTSLDTIFLTWEWQSTWWRHLGTRRGPLYILTVRDDGGLVAIIPLYLSNEGSLRTLQVVGCIEVSDYLDIIVQKGREEEVYGILLDWLDGPEAPSWDLLDLCNQPAVSRAHTLLPELVRQRGWRAEVLQEDVCPVVELPAPGTEPGGSAGWEQYLAGLDKKQRHEIRRKLHRLEREAPGSSLRVIEGGPDLSAWVDQFIGLLVMSAPEKQEFMNEEMRSFFHAIAEVASERGWLQLAFLELDGQPAASYFCFDYANEILVYNSGYDAQCSPQLSPGWVLLARLIEHAIAQGRRRFDFLQGDEEYKYRFGGVDSPVYRTLVRRS
jgi:CelD/BcsL family acetyltransferase involved in cellulose biosynthesis